MWDLFSGASDFFSCSTLSYKLLKLFLISIWKWFGIITSLIFGLLFVVPYIFSLVCLSLDYLMLCALFSPYMESVICFCGIVFFPAVVGLLSSICVEIISTSFNILHILCDWTFALCIDDYTVTLYVNVMIGATLDTSCLSAVEVLSISKLLAVRAMGNNFVIFR